MPVTYRFSLQPLPLYNQFTPTLEKEMRTSHPPESYYHRTILNALLLREVL